MSIPDYETIMLPLLTYLSSVRTATSKECVRFLSEQFNLTDEEKRELLPSGKQYIFSNRFGWARTYLKKAGLVDNPNREVWSITERGIEELKTSIGKIVLNYLLASKESKGFTAQKDNNETKPSDIYDFSKTPKEVLEQSFAKIKDELTQELLAKTKECSPEFFERLVVDLLL